MSLTTFEFDGRPIRAIREDGAPWFVAADLCSALGYQHVPATLKRHCLGEANFFMLRGSRALQKCRVIHVADVMRLAAGSVMPDAYRLETWLLSAALPTMLDANEIAKIERAARRPDPRSILSAQQEAIALQRLDALGLPETDLDRFLSKIEQITETGCWIWMGACKTAGYGDFWFQGRVTGAHRASFTMFNADIPEGEDACHKCDTPQCANPAHLFAGSRLINMQDCARKGRVAKPSAQLTEEQVLEIRHSPLRVVDLALQLGVTESIVRRARKGLTYAP